MKSNKRGEVCEGNCGSSMMRSCGCSKTFVGVIVVAIGVLWFGQLYAWWTSEFVHFCLAVLTIAVGVSLVFRRRGHCCE